MRFIALTLALLLSCPVLAQVPMTGAGLGTSGVAASFSGSGDALAGATAFYSMRAYTLAKATANQKLIGITRVSDSHACDVLAATNGGFGNTGNCGIGGDNGQSISSFCNATTCNVVTLYDQISTADATASGTASVLTLSCQNSLPCASVPGSGWATGTITALTQPVSYSVVMQRTVANVGCWVCDSPSAGSGINFQGTSTASQLQLYAGGGFNIASVTDSAYHAGQVVTNGASSVVNIDGAETSGNAGAQNGATGRGIGAASANGAPFMTGSFIEVRVDNSAYTGPNRTTLCHNQRLFYATPGSC